jgi:hypothetical protein
MKKFPWKPNAKSPKIIQDLTHHDLVEAFKVCYEKSKKEAERDLEEDATPSERMDYVVMYTRIYLGDMLYDKNNLANSNKIE